LALNDKPWKQIEALLPPRKPHPLECHNPRVPDRDAMNAILFALRTGCQWNALDATRHLLVQFGIPTLPGVGGCGRLRSPVANRADEVRWP
jgi:hypothetical protein